MSGFFCFLCSFFQNYWFLNQEKVAIGEVRGEGKFEKYQKKFLSNRKKITTKGMRGKCK